jgi:predicted regulator of Ras-like GTPase activity (Roadblock/LC7/MglB family)
VNVDEAIHDLLSFSTDIRSVAVLGETGEVVAASPQVAAAALQTAAAALWSAAESCASDAGATPLEHVVVQDKSGAVAMLRENGRGIVAVTGPQPAVGLLLFDLRTCLSDAYPEEVAS